MNVKKLISVATIMLTVGMIHAQGSNGLKIHCQSQLDSSKTTTEISFVAGGGNGSGSNC